MAFNISARAFDVIQLCEQGPNTNDHAFLVELNNTVSLVVADGEAEEMEIWMMDMRASSRLLRCQDRSHRHRLLARPSTASSIRCGLAHTMGGELGPRTQRGSPAPRPCGSSPPPADRGRICDHPQHAGADDGGRSVFPKCQSYGGCQSIGTFYSHCCKRMVCSKCISRCTGHHRGLHIPIYSNSMEEIRSNAWPVEHPLVPDPDHYCYYYSDADVDVVRHVFISRRDLVLGVLPCRLTECAYRMDGRGHVIQTWARRYLDFDVGLV